VSGFRNPCPAGDLEQGGRVVARQECRYVARNMTHIKGQISSSLLSVKFAHWNHIAGGMLAVLQWVFPDASYDVLGSTLDSNSDARVFTMAYFAAMTVIVSLLLQGLFVAVVTGTFQNLHDDEISSTTHAQISRVHSALEGQRNEKRDEQKDLHHDHGLAKKSEGKPSVKIAWGEQVEPEVVLGGRFGGGEVDLIESGGCKRRGAAGRRWCSGQRANRWCISDKAKSS
jgi:hypothetical protein